MCNVVLVFSIIDYHLHMYTSSVIELYNSILFAHRALATCTCTCSCAARPQYMYTHVYSVSQDVHVHCIYIHVDSRAILYLKMY